MIISFVSLRQIIPISSRRQCYKIILSVDSPDTNRSSQHLPIYWRSNMYNMGRYMPNILRYDFFWRLYLISEWSDRRSDGVFKASVVRDNECQSWYWNLWIWCFLLHVSFTNFWRYSWEVTSVLIKIVISDCSLAVIFI